VRIGLFTAGSNTPFFTSVLGTTAAQSPFAVNPATATVVVPGTQPGQSVPLTIRAWQGASYATPGQQWREWTFMTRPLGGDTGIGTPVTPPTMTGWGPENGTGYELNCIPEPSTFALGVLGIGALVLARRRNSLITFTMKRSLFTISALALSTSILAQGTTGGTLLFRRAQIQNAAGTANYDVPHFQNNGDFVLDNSTERAGTLPGGVWIGLFTPGSTEPFFTSMLGTSGTAASFAVNPATATVTVPGSTPGQQVPLTIRTWSDRSFAAAQWTVGGNWREWNFTTRPLGGDTGTGTPTTPPTLTGWGPENGAGYELIKSFPEPSTVALGALGITALAFARRRK
jgi:hypothetical protein